MNIWYAVAITLSAGFATVAGAAPQRIVSLNLCADELVLRLGAPGTVKSVTWLARDATLSNVAALARSVPVNRGLAEDVVPLAPDLVIAGAYTTRTAVALLRRLNIEVLELGVPTSVDEALEQIRAVAAALGTPENGVQLTTEIRDGLAGLPVSREQLAQPIAALYQPNGFTIGKGSLVNDLLIRAGLRNLAVERRIDNYGALPLEWLLLAQPDLLVVNAAEDRGPALAYEVLRHPALVQRYRGDRVVGVPSAWWSCPGPRLVDAVQRLRQAARQLPSNASGQR
ncbi:MAG TPA: ABC transporter substrate-binding protein [Burkholderiaceae bacterium]|nr:ABC transporter substrate-binding protein [Burkholderiaceae bacterium]